MTFAELLAAATGFGNGCLQSIIEQQAIGQPGQRVMQTLEAAIPSSTTTPA
jgi:hypothetical protein